MGAISLQLLFVMGRLWMARVVGEIRSQKGFVPKRGLTRPEAGAVRRALDHVQSLAASNYFSKTQAHWSIREGLLSSRLGH